jgi:hypothetical protein
MLFIHIVVGHSVGLCEALTEETKVNKMKWTVKKFNVWMNRKPKIK